MAFTPLTKKSIYDPRKLYAALARIEAEETYNEASEDSAAAATGTLSVAVRNSYVTLDGTDARTLPAPTFANQWKSVYVVAGANTPVLALTVTGMKVAAANVYTSGTWTDTNAPLALHFHSPDGVSWNPPIMTGSWTIS